MNGTEPVTRSEFTTLQQEVTKTFGLLREEMREHQTQMSATLEKIGAEQKEQMERIYKSTRPQVTLWIMLAAVALSVISLIGGLIGYGINRELGHTASAIQSVGAQTSQRVERLEKWQDWQRQQDDIELRERRRVNERSAP